MKKIEFIIQLGKYILALLMGYVIIHQLNEIILYLKIIANG